MKTYLSVMIMAAGLAVALTGCGIKPDHLNPPPGAEDGPFPRTYPAPEQPPF